MKITHKNGILNLSDLNQEVALRGWVSKARNLGGVIFIDLRDKSGIIQLVVNPDNKYYNEAVKIRAEFVIYAKGTVIERSNKNKNIATGEIEITVDFLEIINESQTPPIIISDNTDALEETRLKYRYLDLRRPVMQNYLIKRHEITQAIREFLVNNEFLEIETPILAKSTPEGARDYLVPSRIYPGEFFALPQSPQIFKQLFMVSGFEKYFQIARCFRDEDLRADRQLEFTQVDIEMSFVEEKDVQDMIEQLYAHVFKKVLNIDIPTPFPRISYQESMDKYGSDKPDMRYDLFIENFSSELKDIEMPLIKDCLSNGGVAKGLIIKNASSLTRKIIDELALLAKKYQATNLYWVKYQNKELSGPLAKFLTPDFAKQKKLENEDLVLIVSEKNNNRANTILGALRINLAKRLTLIPKNSYKFAWVVDWPLFDYDPETKNYAAAHHPFTLPKANSLKAFLNKPEEAIACAYDVVINGHEAGGGSLRIYSQEMQERMFQILGLSDEEITDRFGFFVNALKYGTPPHGGIALGLDRLIMLMTNTDNIKDVIAFPKTQSARCQMMDAPSEVANEQLEELRINFKK
ncbi:MAG: aspartate--tRNA ligase [Erysipelotrichales bacterium]|nr:aspartate--tRNA ligase [Erysipelotrichales bacterium]